MHKATLTLQRDNTYTPTYHHVVAASRDELVHTMTDAVRDYASRYGVSPYAVSYAVTLH